jgi:insertion element IS1 protein InsB
MKCPECQSESSVKSGLWNWTECTLMSVQKNYKWVWISVDRNAGEYVDFVVGDRSTNTGIKLWNKVKRFATGFVATDYWKSYNEMIFAEKLLQTKVEIFTVESCNGQIRHFPARFKRKTICYSKSVEMMTLSLQLLMAKINKSIYNMQTYESLFFICRSCQLTVV